MRAFLTRIRILCVQAISALAVLWILATPRNENSVDRLARGEMKRLQSQNEHFQSLRRVGNVKSIIGVIDAHRTAFITLLLVLVGLPLAMINAAYVCWADIPVWVTAVFESLRKPLDVSGDVGDYHSIMATIQATVMALIVPITIAIHDLFQKDKKNKGVIIRLILKETRVHLIIVSTIAFLSWIGFVEFLRISYPSLKYSNFTSVAEFGWFIINLLLIAYFMFTSIDFFNQDAINKAFSRLIIARTYSDEMLGYIKRNIFLNLSRREDESNE